MNKCSICDKPVQEPATECSARCVLEASQRGQAKIVQARSAFTQSMQKMMTPDTGRIPALPEMPMFYVKHRRLKNRNIMHVNLVLCFDDKGLALVEDRGDNRRLAQEACMRSQGQMSLVEPKNPEMPAPTDAPKVEVKEPKVEMKEPKVEVKEPKVEVKEPKANTEDAASAGEKVAEEKDTRSGGEPDAKTKGKTTKKTVGKKSSKK